MCNFLYLTDGREIDVLSGENHRGVARVNTCILHMFRDSVLDYLALVGYSVEFYLLSLCHELRYYYRELF